MTSNKKANVKEGLNLFWAQKVKSKHLDVEDHIKTGKKTRRIPETLNVIDPEKYPLIEDKNNSNENNEKNKSTVSQKLNKTGKNDGEANKDKVKKVIDVDRILGEMKEANKNIIIENANFVVDNIDIFTFKDKRNIDFSDRSKFVTQTYKYINDKILPQIIQKGIKNNGPSQKLKELQKRAEEDPNVQKYCRELEEKIDNDIELKLSDNYYELKNQHIQKIFKNKPKDYYEKKKSLLQGNINEDKTSSIRDNRSNSSSFNKTKLKKRKPTYLQERQKNIKNNDIKIDYNKIYKDTIDNILSAVEEKNISKYINAYLLDKTSKCVLY